MSSYYTPFIGYLASFLQRVIKDDVSKRKCYKVKSLNDEATKTTAVYQAKSRGKQHSWCSEDLSLD